MRLFPALATLTLSSLALVEAGEDALRRAFCDGMRRIAVATWLALARYLTTTCQASRHGSRASPYLCSEA